MSEFVCPKNSKHTLKSTDNDDRFEELTCVSCGSKIYKPKVYSQTVVGNDTTGIELMPESYEIAQEWQPDIDDDDKSFALYCSEANKRY
jgi:hypothetical protein